MGSGQQCVVLGALLLGQLPFTSPNRFLSLSIPSAKVRLRFSPPHPSPRSHTPRDTCCCMNKTEGRREVPDLHSWRQERYDNISEASVCEHTQSPSQG